MKFSKYLEVKIKPKRPETQLQWLKDAEKKLRKTPQKQGIFWFTGEHSYNTVTKNQIPKLRETLERKIAKKSKSPAKKVKSKRRVSRPKKSKSSK